MRKASVKSQKHRLRKVLIIIVISLFSFVALAIILISPLTKYFIEKNSVRYTGRQIRMNWAYVNPFTGYIYLNGLKIYEVGGDTLFISAKGLGVKLSLLKMLHGTYEISSVSLHTPDVVFIKNELQYNFSDIVDRFKPKEGDTTKSKSNVHFNMLDMHIINGRVRYKDYSVPFDYFIKELNFESPGVYWNSDSIQAKVSMVSGPGSGQIKIAFVYKMDNMDYRAGVIINKFDLHDFEQYLHGFSGYGSLNANADADAKLWGNFHLKKAIRISGGVKINDFHFGKTPKDDYASFKKLDLEMDNFNPSGKQYKFKSVSLDNFYFKFEQYDSLDNYQIMFGQQASNISEVKHDPTQFNLLIEIANYFRDITRDILNNDFRFDKIKVNNANILYRDYSLSEEFALALNPFNMKADSVVKSKKRVNIYFNSGVKPYGNINLLLNADPKEVGNFAITYHIQQLPVSLFNPFLLTYTSFPLDRGTLEYKGYWSVVNSEVQSENHFLLLDPRVSKRRKNKANKWIPMPLVMAFARDRGDVIDYYIPITGNLKDPKFHWRNVILNTIRNIFIKPPTIPYRFQVRSLETTIERSHYISWQMGLSDLRPAQRRFLSKMATFLKKDKDVTINVYPMLYTEKEKEYVLMYRARKKYYMEVNHKKENELTEGNLRQIEHMSIKDPAFIHYLKNHAHDTMIFTVQQRSILLVGSKMVDILLNELIQARDKAFMEVFEKEGVADRVKIHAAESIIPYNGFSYFKISYNGEIPDALEKAYETMNDLNGVPPRKKYLTVRRKAGQQY